MTIAQVSSSQPRLRTQPRLRITTALLALALLLSASPCAFGQRSSGPALPLPDSPGFVADRESSSLDPDLAIPQSQTQAQPRAQPASPNSKHAFDPNLTFFRHHDITIEPGQTVPRLTGNDKRVLGLEQSFTLFSAIGWITSAGYSHLVNGSPNYGTDSGAFGMRLGATAVRATSQNILGNALFAPLFHQDPRYYKLGKGNSFLRRAAYAATRAVITRNDDGANRPNYSLLAGNLAGAALTNAYYPTLNQGFGPTAKTFGSSVGGSAIGFVVSEFLYDGLEYAHLKRFE